MKIPNTGKTVDYKSTFEKILDDKKYLNIYKKRLKELDDKKSNWVKVLIPSLKKWKQLKDCGIDSEYLFGKKIPIDRFLHLEPKPKKIEHIIKFLNIKKDHILDKRFFNLSKLLEITKEDPDSKIIEKIEDAILSLNNETIQMIEETIYLSGNPKVIKYRPTLFVLGDIIKSGWNSKEINLLSMDFNYLYKSGMNNEENFNLFNSKYKWSEKEWLAIGMDKGYYNYFNNINNYIQ